VSALVLSRVSEDVDSVTAGAGVASAEIFAAGAAAAVREGAAPVLDGDAADGESSSFPVAALDAGVAAAAGAVGDEPRDVGVPVDA